MICLQETHVNGGSLLLKTLFPGLPIMVHDVHTRRRSKLVCEIVVTVLYDKIMSAVIIIDISISVIISTVCVFSSVCL